MNMKPISNYFGFFLLLTMTAMMIMREVDVGGVPLVDVLSDVVDGQ